MAHELHIDKHTLPLAVATDLLPRMPVKFAGTNTLMCAPVGSANEQPFGVTGPASYVATSAAIPAPGREKAAVYFSQNSMKVRTAASVGVGAAVIVGSTNGVVIPGGITASAHWILGDTLEDGLAGEIITIFVNPRKA